METGHWGQKGIRDGSNARDSVVWPRFSRYYETAPSLIVEVLSPRAAANDDGEKRVNYQSLSSLDEYLLLNPDTGDGTLYRRIGAFWTRIQLDRGDPLELRSVALQATMAWFLGSSGAEAGNS